MKVPTRETIFCEQLRSQGHRLTRARHAMIHLFATHQYPLTADDVLRTLAKRRERIHKTTVYRELEFLVLAGIIYRVTIGDRGESYELVDRRHHHHAVCTTCHKVTDIATTAVEKALQSVVRRLATAKKFRIDEHVVEFKGQCKQCQNKI